MKAPDAKQSVPIGSSEEGLKRKPEPGIQWTATGDEVAPFRASVNGENWVIRINDFPAEHLYSLVVDGHEAKHFDDWPPTWLRPGGRTETPSPLDLHRLLVEGLRTAEIEDSGSDDISLSELVRSLRSLAADTPEGLERIEQLARLYAKVFGGQLRKEPHRL